MGRKPVRLDENAELPRDLLVVPFGIHSHAELQMKPRLAVLFECLVDRFSRSATQHVRAERGHQSPYIEYGNVP